MNLSAVILTKNEEANLPRCLKSLNFVQEIVVIDDGSSDKTLTVAKEFHASIYHRVMASDFSSQRNFGLQKSKGDWVLFIDADEEITLELREQIKNILEHPKADAYYIKRRDYFWNKELKHGETNTARKKGFLRLMKKGSGQWQGLVHETFITKGKTATLDGFLNHYPHFSITQFIQAVNNYSTLRALELFRAGKKESVIEIVFFPIAKFIYTYFIKLGFLDGTVGFIYSFFMSWHSYLVRAKLWQYRKLGLPD